MASQVNSKKSISRLQARTLKLNTKSNDPQEVSKSFYFTNPNNKPKAPISARPSQPSPAYRSSKFTLSQSTSFSQLHSPRALALKEAPVRSCLSNSQSQSSSLSSVVKSVKSSRKSKDACYREHLFQTFQAMKFIRTLRHPTFQELNNKTVYLPKRKGYEGKKTVVFDLDETLVHCEEDVTAGDVLITVTFPNGQKRDAGIRVRPFAREVLRAANRDYEVIVFTASHKCYADKVLDYLDPTGELIHHRLYRENCLGIEGLYLKDLRVLANRRLEEVVIVDNAAYSFAYQLHNGVPIISWYEDASDKELYKLIAYLKCLAQIPDIRVLNRQTFKLDTFYDDYLSEITESKENQANSYINSQHS